MANPWDEYSAGGEYVEFLNVGDEFAGTIRSITAKVWDDGKKSPALLMTPCESLGSAPTGEDITLTASWVMLVSALKREAPNVGDHLRVKWSKVGPKPKETREWEIVVTRGNGQLPASMPAAAPAPAPAAEVPAGITPEQLAAMQAAMAPAAAWDSDPRVAQLRGMGIADEAIRSTLNI